MATWLTDDGELDRLNAFCTGKVLAHIEYCGGIDDLILHFSDGSSARLSTLGGVEIEELEERDVDGNHCRLF